MTSRFLRDPTFDGFEIYSVSGNKHLFPKHFHCSFTITFVEKGAICSPLHGVVGRKHIALTNPCGIHTGVPLRNKRVSFTSLHIKYSLLKNITEELFFKSSIPFPEFEQTHLRVNRIMLELKKKLVCQFDKNVQRSVKEETLLMLVHEIYQNTNKINIRKNGHRKHNHLDNKVIRTMIDYIWGNIQKRITLDELSEITKINKFSLVKLITNKIGVAPHQIHILLRIEKAKKLLKRNLTISEVSFRSGFSDQAHLTRTFKRIMGLTPKRYVGGS